MALSFDYGKCSVYSVFSLCIQIGTSGAGRYNDSYAEWCCGVFYPGGGSFTAPEDYGAKWYFLCRDYCLDWCCGVAGGKLLYPYKKIQKIVKVNYVNALVSQL